MSATILPLPLVRARWREAVGHVLSGEAARESLRDTSMRYLRSLHPDVRKALAAKLAWPQPAPAGEGAA